jgi:chaperonin cofactor prefoldin
VVQAQYAIVQQKMEHLHEMKTQLEERLKTFERWSSELELLEDKAPVAGG